MVSRRPERGRSPSTICFITCIAFFRLIAHELQRPLAQDSPCSERSLKKDVERRKTTFLSGRTIIDVGNASQTSLHDGLRHVMTEGSRGKMLTKAVRTSHEGTSLVLCIAPPGPLRTCPVSCRHSFKALFYTSDGWHPNLPDPVGTSDKQPSNPWIKKDSCRED